MKASFKASLVAIAIATLPLGSLAAGLGQINVVSGLGQPLRAEIPLHATPQELKSLTARLASSEAFRQASIPYSPAASSVRVSVDTSGQRPVLRLSSQRPVNDPFIELLIELNWSSGQLLRQYTFLLDPVDLVAPQPVAAAIRPPAAAPRAVSPAPARAPASGAAASASSAGASNYTVRKGDTLHRIAGTLAPAGVNLDQMLVGLLRANPEAFDDGNINRLRSGVILSVPPAARLAAIDAADARREVLAQASDFEAFRRRLAGVASARETGSVAAVEQSSGGQIVPRVEEARPARAAGDQLQISRNDAAGNNDAVVRLQKLEEELVAREKALLDASTRLGELEQSVRSMQSLLELRGKLPLPEQMAGAESAPAAAASRVPPAAETAAAVPPAAVASANPPAAQTSAAAPVSGDTAQKLPASAAAAAGDSAPAAATEAAAEPAPAVEESSALDDALVADLTLLGAGGAVVALLLAYIALRRRRLSGARAAAAELEPFEPLVTAPATQQEIVDRTVMTEAGEPRGEPGTHARTSALRRAPTAALDDAEGVDPVAEAEVYMAYGRDAQAVEILLDAMRTDPARTAIQLKLLEIYAQHKSVAEFETVARILHARTGAQGSEWVRAALLGSQLDPANPLYGRNLAAPAKSAFAAASAAPAPVPAFLGVAEPVATSRTAAVAAGGLAAGAAVAALRPEPSAPPVPPPPAPAPMPAVDERAGQSLSALDFTASQPFDESFSQMKETWVLPGQNAQYGNGAEASAAPSEFPGVTMAPPLESGAVQAAANSNVIDFDLGLDDTPSRLAEAVTLPALELSSAHGASATVPATGWSDDGPATEGLVFDMDLGGADEVPSKLPLSPQTVLPATMVSDDEAPASAMFDLDFDLPRVDTPAADTGEPATSALNPYTLSPEPDTARPADSELEINFNLDFPVQDESAAHSAALMPDIPTLAPFDLQRGTPEVPSPLEGEPDRPAGEPTHLGDAPASTLVADVAADDLETKLQLVRVYDEMGDREAALALLDEIVREVGLGRPEVRKLIVRLG